jgi:hypothetical protein
VTLAGGVEGWGHSPCTQHAALDPGFHAPTFSRPRSRPTTAAAPASVFTPAKYRQCFDHAVTPAIMRKKEKKPPGPWFTPSRSTFL